MAESSLIKVPLQTKDGPICGCVEETDLGNFYCFYGIPYAKPPLGTLRFLPPVPFPPWDKEIECTQKEQKYFEECHWAGIEDCLYINVRTKHMNPIKPLPVMFWVGGFNYSGTLEYLLESSLLVDEEIIFVNCGYRLGPFGFLSINDLIAPGNAGLKDVALALKWVQRNIAAFGGDPNNVTIFGSSSGAVIVHLMMLSTMTTGLFHKAIIQSVCALNNWAVSKNPSQSVLDLAKELRMEITSKFEIVEKLKTMPAKLIMDTYGRMEKEAVEIEANVFNPLFKPCIEEEFEGQAAFLTKSPALIVKSGKFNKVPVIIGSNNVEALVLQLIRTDKYSNYQMYNESRRLLIPKTLAGELDMSKSIEQQVMQFYIGDEENLHEGNQGQLMQLISDYYFLYYINKAVGFHNQYAPECPVYYYIFNYAGDWLVPKDLNMFNSIGHHGELPYIFRIRPPGMTNCASASRDTLMVRKRVVKMWTNFAKYGNPTPDEDVPLLQINWDPVESTDRLNYLSIGSELTKGRNPFDDRMKFWDKLHNDHTFLRAVVYFNDMGVQW